MRKGRLQKSVRPAQWPAGEQELLRRAFERKGRRFKPGPGNGWAPATSRTVLSSYCCGLGWLQDHGLLDWSLPPAARWSENIVIAYRDHLLETYAEATVYARISGLERALSALDPTGDRLILKELKCQLGKPGPSSARQEQVRNSGELLELGIEMMDRAGAGGRRAPRLIAARYRNGLQIALLSLRFWRISEFVALQLGLHVVERYGYWTMSATKCSSSTKRQMQNARIPDVLVPYLRTYIRFYRKMLCMKCVDGRFATTYEGDALWVSAEANVQSENSLRDNIKKGTGIPPHAFRHSAATTMAIHAPHQIEAVGRVMGHVPGSRVQEEHYNLATDYSASRQWAETWTGLLKDARKRRRLSRKR